MHPTSTSLPQLTALLVGGDAGATSDVVVGLERLRLVDPSAVLAQQLAQLEGILRLLRDHPFWKERLARAELPWTLDRFRQLPLLTKAELADAGRALELPNVPPGFRPIGEAISSGSTGTPLATRSSTATSAFQRALQLRMMRAHGWDLSATMLFLAVPQDGGSTSEVREASSWASPLGRGKSLHFDLRASVDEQLAVLVRLRPRYLATYPSNLAQLLERIEDGAAAPAGLAGIVLSSEPIAPDLPARARALLGAPVIATYSASEVGLVAYDEPNLPLRVASENVLVELLRDDGSPAAPGEVGRVVVTTLQDLLRPLVRYELGDYAIAHTSYDGLPLSFERIEGRQRSLLELPDGRRVWPYFEFEGLAGRRPFRRWQIRQRADLSLDVALVPREPFGDEERALVRAVVEKALPGLPLRLREVPDLPRTPRGKFLEVLRETDETAPDR